MTTLLNGVNAVLKKRKLVEGDATALTSLTDSSRQLYIDSAIALWNEAIDELYTTMNTPLPKEQATTTITLVNGTRDYTLPSDLVQIRWPLIDETNGQVIEEYPGGYDQMRRDQLIPSNFTGLPIYGAISPVDEKLYFDRIPQSTEAGLVYTLAYDKDLALATESDTFPFSDAVYRALVPVVAEFMRRDFDSASDPATIRLGIGRASRLITMSQGRDSWTPQSYGGSSTDPYSDA